MKLISNKHFKTTNTDKSAEQLLEKHEKVTDNYIVESVISFFTTEIMLRMDLLLASTGRKYHVHVFNDFM